MTTVFRRIWLIPLVTLMCFAGVAPLTAQTISLEVSNSNPAEGAGVTITARLNANANAAYTIPLTYTNGTAETTDYTSVANVSILANSRTGTVNLPIVDDSTYEGGETFTLAFGTLPGGVSAGATTSITLTIDDSDDTPIYGFTQATRTVIAAEGTAATIAFSREGATEIDVTLPIQVIASKSTATATDDYTAPAATFLFPASSTTASFTLQTASDTSIENQEKLTLGIGSFDHGTVPSDFLNTTAAPELELLIEDKFRLSFDNPFVAVTENDATLKTANYTMELAEDPGINVTVTVMQDDSTALNVDTDSNTMGRQSTWTFTHGSTGTWSTAQTVRVIAVDDLDDQDEDVKVQHHLSATGYTVAGGYVPYQVDVDVTDDGLPPPGINIVETNGDTIVGEDGTTDTYTVVLNSQPRQSVAVRFEFSVEGVVSLNRATLPFLPSGNTDKWDVPQTITVSAVSDGIDQPGTPGSRTVTITHKALSAANDYNNLKEDLEVTVQDDDISSQPELSITGPNAAVTEGSSAVFTINSNTALTENLTVNLTVTDAAGSDYLASSSEGAQTVSFSSGATSTTYSVSTNGDSTDEENGDISVALSTGTGYTVSTSAGSATATIQDNDQSTLSISGGATDLTEGSSREFTIALSTLLRQGTNLSFNVTTNSGASAATLGTDYTLTCKAPIPTSWSCAQFSASSQISITGSNTDYPNTLALTLTSTSDSLAETGGEDINLGLGSLSVTGTAVANGLVSVDSAAAFKLLDPALNNTNLSISSGGAITEGGTALDITATLDTANSSGSAISIPVVIRSTGTTALPADYTLTSPISIANNAATGTTTLAVTNDSIDEPDETVVVELGSNLPAGIGRGSTSHVAATITDNDVTQVTFASTTSAIPEASGTKTATVSLGRRLETSEVLPVTLALSGTATRGTDYAVTCASATGVACTGLNTNSVTITFTGSASAAQVATLTFTATQDSSVESNESITLTLGALTSSSGTNLDGGASGSGGPFTFNITDDDTASTAGVRISQTAGSTVVTEASGGANNDIYRIRLESQPTADVIITATSATTGAALVHTGSDTPGATTTLTFTPSGATAWNVFQTVTVTGVDDNINQSANKTSVISHTASSTDTDYDGITITSVTAQVIDDEEGDIPVVSFAVAAASVSESSGTRQIAVQINPAPTAELEVSYGVDGTADTPADFSISGSGTFTVSANATTASIPISIVDDSTEESDETVILTLTDFPSYNLGTNSSYALTIQDNDSSTPRVSVVADGNVTEGDVASFTFTAAPTPAADLTVNVVVAEGASSDFISSSLEGNQQVTIDTSGSGTLTLQTVDDSTDEVNGTISVTVSSGTGYTIGTPSSASLTVSDNDTNTDPPPPPPPPQPPPPPPPVTPPATAPVLSIVGGSQITEGEIATFTISASSVPSSNLTIQLNVTDAGSGDVLSSTQEGTKTVQLAPNTQTASYRVQSINDDVDEENGSIQVTLQSGTGYKVGTPNTANVLVLDDDISAPTVPSVSFSSASQIQPEGADTLNLKILLSLPPNQSLTIPYSISGSATEGTDFSLVGSNGVVNVDAGIRTAELSINLVDDAIDEDDEFIYVRLQQGTGYTLGSPLVHALLIEDDDSAGIVLTESEGNTEVTESDGVNHTDSYEISLLSMPTENVQINVISSNPDALLLQIGSSQTSSTRVSVTFAPDTWQQRHTITVVGVDDSDHQEANRSAVITHAIESVDPKYQRIDVPSIEVTIVDDDPPLPTISIRNSQASLTEGENATFIVNSDLQLLTSLAINLSVTQEGQFVEAQELGEREHTLTAQRTSWEVTIPTVNDDQDEPNGAVLIELVSLETYALGQAVSARISVLDNDEPPPETADVSLSAMPNPVQEGSSARVSAHLSNTLPEAVQVPLTYSNLTAEDGDYRAPEMIEVAAGSLIGEIVLQTVEDTDLDDEEINIALASSLMEPLLTGATQSINLTILDGTQPLNTTPWLASMGRIVGEQQFQGVTERLYSRAYSLESAELSHQSSYRDSQHVTQGWGSATNLISNSFSSKDYSRDLWVDSSTRLLEAAQLRNQTYSSNTGQQLVNLFSRASFTKMVLNGADGNLGFWGRGTQTRMSTKDEETSLDGDLLTGMLGIDWGKEGWVLGLLTAHSRGESDYQHNEVNGRLNMSLISLTPYVSTLFTDYWFIWAAAGRSWGELELQEGGDLVVGETADLVQSLGAIGVRGEVYANEQGLSVAVLTDAMVTETTTENGTFVMDGVGGANRLRLVLETDWSNPINSNSSLNLHVDAGLRHDGGDAEAGLGAELTAGIDWVQNTIKVGLEGNWLLNHAQENYSQSGWSVDLNWNPSPGSALGPSAEVRHGWGFDSRREIGNISHFASQSRSFRPGSMRLRRQQDITLGWGFSLSNERWIMIPQLRHDWYGHFAQKGAGWILRPQDKSILDLNLEMWVMRRGLSPSQGYEYTFNINRYW